MGYCVITPAGRLQVVLAQHDGLAHAARRWSRVAHWAYYFKRSALAKNVERLKVDLSGQGEGVEESGMG